MAKISHRPASPQERKEAKARFPVEIQKGLVHTWLKDRVKPVSSFKDAQELLEADRKVFNTYLNQRNKYYCEATNKKPQFTRDKRKKYHPAANDFLDSLSQSSIYYATPENHQDMDQFTDFVNQRVKEFEEAVQASIPQAEANETQLSESKPDSHPQVKQVLSQVAKQSPAAIQVQTQVEQTNPVTTATEDTKITVTAKDGDKHEITRHTFPPLMLVKKAKLKQLKREHQENLKRIHETEANKRNAEVAVRQFDAEKSPYIYSGQALPKELQQRMEIAHNAVLKAEEQRTEAAQKYNKTSDEVTRMILDENQNSKPKPKKPFDHKVRTKKSTYPNFVKNLKKLRNSRTDEAAAKMRFIAALHNDPRNIDELEKIAIAVDNREYSSLKSLCKGVVLKDVSGDDINLHDLLKDLIKSARQVDAAEGWFDSLNIDQALLFSQRKFDELNPKDHYAVSLSTDEMVDLELSKFEMLRARLRKVRSTKVDPVKAKAYKEKLRKLQIGYPHLNEALYRTTRTIYSDIRTRAIDIPQQSITGQAHRYQETIDIAGKDYDNMHAFQSARRKEDGDIRRSWHFREANSLGTLESIGLAEVYTRLSARVIADPNLIRELDKLAMKYDFLYKIPSQERDWGRADTLTIYLYTLDKNYNMAQDSSNLGLDIDAYREICDTLKGYIFEGDDNRLLGEPIPDENDDAYPGIRIAMQPNANEIAELLERAYMIDDDLAQYLMDNDFDLKITNSSCRYRTSPGIVEAVRILLDRLEEGIN